MCGHQLVSGGVCGGVLRRRLHLERNVVRAKARVGLQNISVCLYEPTLSIPRMDPRRIARGSIRRVDATRYDALRDCVSVLQNRRRDFLRKSHALVIFPKARQVCETRRSINLFSAFTSISRRDTPVFARQPYFSYLNLSLFFSFFTFSQ